jgi:hypothetical protein
MEKESEVSNILIVESKNDKIFLEALIRYLNYQIEIDAPIQIDDYEELQGLNEKNLIRALKELKASIQKKGIKKIGIVIDIDNYSLSERIDWLNSCLQSVFNDVNLVDINQLMDISLDNNERIQIACYFTNIDGQGELETVLKTIKHRNSPYADCLEDWRNCIMKQGQEIKQKDFDKFWVSLYLRYDTCSKKEQKQAERKCSMNAFDYVMQHKTAIWNFEHPSLQALKDFLQLFNN